MAQWFRAIVAFQEYLGLSNSGNITLVLGDSMSSSDLHLPKHAGGIHIQAKYSYTRKI